jgi:hypothetical protein
MVRQRLLTATDSIILVRHRYSNPTFFVVFGLAIAIRIHVARSRHMIRVELGRLLQLYSYLEFEARELYGKMGTRGADGTNSARGYGVIVSTSTQRKPAR